MVGDDPVMLAADIQLLRDKHFLVYTDFNTDNLNPLIEEICPDLLFINPQNANAVLDEVYNAIAADTWHTGPVVYTLQEDDVYLVTKKNVATGNTTVIADNILSAIKMAFDDDKNAAPKTAYSRLRRKGAPALVNNHL